MKFLARLLPRPFRRWLLAALGDESSEKYARAFHASPDWIVITRLSDGLVLEANQGFQAISGYAPDEVMGRPMSEFKVWVHAEQRHQLVDEMMAQGIARERLVQLRSRDGSVRDCMVYCSLISLDGRTQQHAVWIARDVTEQNAIHEQFRAAFRLTPDVMSITRLSDGRYIEVNAAFERVLGRSREDTIGRTSSELNIWHDPSQRESLVQKMLEHGTVNDHFMLLRARDGQVREALLNAATFEARGERLIISLLRDVTDERRAQQEIHRLNTDLEQRVAQRTAELQNTNQELSETLATLQRTQRHLVQSEKLAALGALVAGIAHELNTPIGNGLTVASTFEDRVKQLAEQVESGLRRSDLVRFLSDAQQSADILQRNLTRASELVISFKQVAVDQTSSQRRQFDLADVVSEIITTMSPSIRKSGCQVETRIGGPLRMDSYPGPLGQVLSNLINNAMLHGFSDGHHGHILVDAQRLDDATLLLRVCDDGKGIRSDDLHRVFEPFFTTRLGLGGSGLGLHIAHNIVSGALGGQIDVQSQAGHGACFSLTLPLVAPLRDSEDLSQGDAARAPGLSLSTERAPPAAAS